MAQKSRYKGSWVWLNTCFSEYAFKCKIISLGKEAGCDVYNVQYENGEREPIFVNSVTRIFPNQQRKARVIDMKTRIKLVRSG